MLWTVSNGVDGLATLKWWIDNWQLLDTRHRILKHNQNQNLYSSCLMDNDNRITNLDNNIHIDNVDTACIYCH